MKKFKRAEEYIFHNIKKNKKSIIILSLLSLAVSWVSVMLASVSKRVLDTTLSGESSIGYAIVLVAGVVLLQMALQIVLSAASVTVEARTIIGAKNKFFSSVLNKKLLDIRQYHTGDLMRRINADVYTLFDGVIDIIPVTVSLISQIIFSFVLLFRYDAVYALFYMLAIPLVILVGRMFKTRLKKIYKESAIAESKVNGNLQENFYNIPVTKAFSKEESKISVLSELQKQSYSCIIKRNKLSIFLNLSFSMLLTAGYFATVVWGAYRVSTNFYTFGTLVAMIELISLIQTPLKSVSSVIPQFYSMVASGERVLEILNLEDDGQNEALADDINHNEFEKICIEDVTYAYDETNVLEHFSATVKKGEFALLTGESGIGKSTLTLLLMGIIKPDGGAIKIFAGDRQYFAGKNTRKLFSYVPQGNMIFSGTIKDNITFNEENPDEERLEKAIYTASLDEVIPNLDDGLDTYLKENGAGLSEGQNQRVAIARAVYENSQILVLDEATSALDNETEKKVLSRIKELGKTSIMISHKQEAREYADTVIHFMSL